MSKLVFPLAVHGAAAVPWQGPAPLRYQGVVRKSMRFSTGFELRIKVCPYQGYGGIVAAVVNGAMSPKCARDATVNVPWRVCLENMTVGMDRVLSLSTSAPPSDEGKGLDGVCSLGLHSMASAPWNMWIETEEGGGGRLSTYEARVRKWV